MKPKVTHVLSNWGLSKYENDLKKYPKPYKFKKYCVSCRKKFYTYTDVAYCDKCARHNFYEYKTRPNEIPPVGDEE